MGCNVYGHRSSVLVTGHVGGMSELQLCRGAKDEGPGSRTQEAMHVEFAGPMHPAH